MTHSRLLTLSFLLVSSLAIACGSDDDSSGSSNGGSSSGGSSSGGSGAGGSGAGTSGGDGTTDCYTAPLPELKCAAGQYCDDADLRICATGCLSNTNCASDQTCDKAAGNNVGSCQNNVSTGNTSEADFVAKCLACGGGPESQCKQIYAAVNETCRACVVAANCTDDTACMTECSLE